MRLTCEEDILKSPLVVCNRRVFSSIFAFFKMGILERIAEIESEVCMLRFITKFFHLSRQRGKNLLDFRWRERKRTRRQLTILDC